MPIRFQAYRMRDGVTPLAEDYFNPVLAEIDSRIAALEDKRAELQNVIDELSTFGLQRIDILMGPAINALNDAMADVVERRDQLVAAIGNLSELVLQAQLNSAIANEQAARQSAIANEQAARQQADAQLMALIAAAL